MDVRLFSYSTKVYYLVPLTKVYYLVSWAVVFLTKVYNLVLLTKVYYLVLFLVKLDWLSVISQFKLS